MMFAATKIAGTGRDEYEPDGPIAKQIAAVTPYFPFKGIPRFYDIGGFLKEPAVFALTMQVLFERYKDQEIDSICGLDARGFVLGPPLALALGKPFFMMRKKGKMPNAVYGAAYTKEYAGSDSLGLPRDAVKKGDRVLVVDDLVATGGTLKAAIKLIQLFEGVVVECACIVEIKGLDARAAFDAEDFQAVPIWAMMSEDILLNDGMANANIPTDGYADDGEAH